MAYSVQVPGEETRHLAPNITVVAASLLRLAYENECDTGDITIERVVTSFEPLRVAEV